MGAIRHADEIAFRRLGISGRDLGFERRFGPCGYDRNGAVDRRSVAIFDPADGGNVADLCGNLRKLVDGEVGQGRHL